MASKCWGQSLDSGHTALLEAHLPDLVILTATDEDYSGYACWLMTCENSLATERADQRKRDPFLTYLIWFQNTKDGDGENAHHRPMDNLMAAKSTAAVVFMTLATYFELHQLCILYIEETSTQIS